MLLGRFVWWILEQVTERAETEWYSPEAIRQELSQLEHKLANREITVDEYREREKKLFDRLLEGQERGIE